MYMCIAMDYFPKGHLGQYIDEKRQSKEIIDEEVRLQIWSNWDTVDVQVFY